MDTTYTTPTYPGMTLITRQWIGATIFLIVLQIVASAIRYYSRAIVIKRLGWDDLWSFIGLIFSLAYNGGILYLCYTSHGLNILYMNPKYIIPDINVMTASALLFGIGTLFIKIALGCFLLRIFGVQRTQRIIVYVTVGGFTLFTIFFFLFSIFICGNPANLAINVILDKCPVKSGFIGIGYAHSVITALVDVVLASLPISYLMTANMSRRTKWSVGGIMALAFVGCLISIVRIGFIHYLLNGSLTTFVDDGSTAFLSAAELCIGIVCLAFTTYKPLFRKGFFNRSSAIDSSDEKRGSAPTPYVPQEDSLDRLDRNKKRPRDPYDLESGVHDGSQSGTVSDGDTLVADDNSRNSRGKFSEASMEAPVVDQEPVVGESASLWSRGVLRTFFHWGTEEQTSQASQVSQVSQMSAVR